MSVLFFLPRILLLSCAEPVPWMCAFPFSIVLECDRNEVVRRFFLATNYDTRHVKPVLWACPESTSLCLEVFVCK